MSTVLPLPRMSHTVKASEVRRFESAPTTRARGAATSKGANGAAETPGEPGGGGGGGGGGLNAANATRSAAKRSVAMSTKKQNAAPVGKRVAASSRSTPQTPEFRKCPASL